MKFWLATICALASANVAQAARDLPQGVEPKQVSDALACAKIADNQARLACYDKTIGILKSAVSANDILVVDKEGIKKAKKSLFGLSLPNFDFFTGTHDSEDTQITATISSAHFDGNGTLSFTLDNDATWIQTDDYSLPTLPKPGTSVTIKRGSMGSFFASYGHLSFRARRLN